ncbi:RNA-directed DNA polymerase from mobile element jockey [Trichonephila clavipes]|nr:RNA-directed DNA polymerase from mobile element jockey [Trichonephila clavipes]
MQRFLDKLENWLTDWRIAINVEKTQAIVFRKWGVIDSQTELTLFDDNIQWVPVVRYLGLHIDSRLTYKNHIDYLSDKFWGRIALAISLIGRSSPLSLENKVILYKQILRPTITEGILKSHSLSSLLNFLRAFGDGPVAGVSGGQGIESWLACLEFEPSATKKTRRVGQRCTLNLSRAEMSSRWCGVVVRRGGASSGVALVI